MKKVLFGLFVGVLMFLSLSTQAQYVNTQSTHTTFYIQPGVSAGVDKVLNENLDAGVQFNKNRFALTGQSYRISDDNNRQYLLGIRYTHEFPIMPGVGLLASLGAKTSTTDISMYSVEPGLGVELHLNPNVSIVTGVTSPVTQTSFNDRSATFSGNAGLKINLN